MTEKNAVTPSARTVHTQKNFPNSFRFQRESADTWKAILTWKEADGTLKERVYKMERMPPAK
ncbi:MAG TPA: hypothetical protein VFH31_02940 [Pyrinomonadaceae bacterium]|nr:hypothetical protein [Pyrinomonadaceae bacterium]